MAKSVLHHRNAELLDGSLNNDSPEVCTRDFTMMSSRVSALNDLSLENSPKIDVEPCVNLIDNRHEKFASIIGADESFREGLK